MKTENNEKLVLIKMKIKEKKKKIEDNKVQITVFVAIISVINNPPVTRPPRPPTTASIRPPSGSTVTAPPTIDYTRPPTGSTGQLKQHTKYFSNTFNIFQVMGRSRWRSLAVMEARRQLQGSKNLLRSLQGERNPLQSLLEEKNPLQSLLEERNLYQ